MFEADRLPAAPRKLEKRAFPAWRLQAGYLRERARGRDRDATATATQRGGMILPVLLVIALAVAAVGLSPATAQVCSKLDEFPCGP